MKKGTILAACAGAAALSLAGLALTGRKIGWGPFGHLCDWDQEVDAIAKKYPADRRQHEIVFYGASNFRLWTEMEEDLSGYKVQNHGFGGSTDKLLVRYAPVLLYPYEPDVVFFQTGSNDYVSLQGTEEDKVSGCMAYKKQMFETFHEKLPEARFVVMSGLLLPGRAQYAGLTQKINRELAALCAEKDYMTFLDATCLTYDVGSYHTVLFQEDGIHLNHEGQILWMDDFIQPEIERLIDAYGLYHLRKPSHYSA